MQWHCLSFEELSLRQLYELAKLRQIVFVVEQNAAYLDFDGKDYPAQHVFAELPDGSVAAYARIIPPDVAYPGEYSIGRVVNHPDHRGQGLGRQLFALAMQRCYALYGPVPVRISAQTYLEQFYQSFGFVSTDDRYLEDGLPHVEMFFPVEHWPESLSRIAQGAWLPSLA